MVEIDAIEQQQTSYFTNFEWLVAIYCSAARIAG